MNVGLSTGSALLRIGRPVVTVEPSATSYRATVKKGDGETETLWFRVDSGMSQLVSSRVDAALVAMLIPAMHGGMNLEVDGETTAELVHQLRHGVQDVLAAVIPTLRRVDVAAQSESPALSAGPGVATGFSAGIDSYATVADYFISPDIPYAYRLTHLLFNNVGSHGPGPEGRSLFERRLARTRIVAAKFGLPVIGVDSNLDDFFGPLDFDQTHTIRNASVAFLLQGVLGRFLYSGSGAIEHVAVKPSRHMAAVDPVILPMLGTPALDLRAVGLEYPRTMKTMRVAGLPQAWDSLDVCIDPETSTNCSVCWKCLRTQLTLEIGGVLPRFASVFDIGRYEAARSNYIAEVLASDEVGAIEIREFARLRRFVFPWFARLGGASARAMNRTTGLLPKRARWALAHPIISSQRVWERGCGLGRAIRVRG